MQITVTGDLGQFSMGQILTEDKDIALYYRTIVNEGRVKGDTTLTDDQILQAVKAVEGDSEDEEVLRVEELERLDPDSDAKHYG